MHKWIGMANCQIILFLYLGSAQTAKIWLSAPRYAKRGDSIEFNCTSESVPLGNSAEFLRNGETYASLRHHQDGCFSAGIHLNCSIGECKCGMDGKSFVLKIRNFDSMELNEIEMSCVMKFLSGREISSSRTEILDIIGPYISTDEDFSFAVGKTVEFKCSVTSQLQNIVLEWQCSVEKTNVETHKTQDIYVSSFDTTLKKYYHGKTCTCTAMWKTFSPSVSVNIHIIYPPIVALENSTTCTDSLPVELTCHLGGDLNIHGFMKWRQIINGVHVRDISGNDNANSSTLKLPCSYQNSGFYICSGWNKYENKTYIANKTIEVIIQKAPIIFGKSVYTGNTTVTVISVHYLPLSKEYSTTWFKNSQPITSLMPYIITEATQNGTLLVYGKNVEVTGFVSNISIGNKSPGKYTVVMRNRFGTTKYEFSLENGNHNIGLQNILLGLTGITLLIVVFVLVAVVKKSRNNVTLSMISNDSIRSRAIYYAAPPVETNTHVYDTADLNYSEILPYQSSRLYTDLTENKNLEDDSLSQQSSESSPQYIEIT